MQMNENEKYVEIIHIVWIAYQHSSDVINFKLFVLYIYIYIYI